MSYEAILEYIYRQLPMYQRQGRSAFKKDLSNIRALCTILNNPQDKLKVIHIAGTNGKGSTSHIIASILQEYGFQVGLYTSPHYSDFRERIKISGIFIEKDYVTRFVNQIKPHLEYIQASFFEITVAMAFNYFADRKVDYAVIETGLGGRLDSTNIVQPILSVITNIGFDHMDMLGDTIPKIAFEKAGIIKPGVPVVIGEEGPESDPVFISRSMELAAPIYFAKDLLSKHEVGAFYEYSENSAPYFEKNLRTALSAIRLMEDEGFLLPPSGEVERGIKNLRDNTFYIGRWEVLQKNPLAIADSAHNEDGFTYVLERLSKEKYSDLHILLGFVKDKDIHKILSKFPKDAIYYFTNAKVPRALPGKELKQLGKKNGLKGRSYISVKNAIKAIKRNAKVTDLIYMGGSIFVVGEVLGYFKISKAS